MAPKSARTVLLASALFRVLGGGFGLHALLTAPPPAGGSGPLGRANTAEALQSAFVSVAERVRPAVVHIGTVQVARLRRPPTLGPFADDPAFKDFFDQFSGAARGGGERSLQPGPAPAATSTTRATVRPTSPSSPAPTASSCARSSRGRPRG